MNATTKKLLNILLFQIGWFACVLGGNYIGVLGCFIILILHQYFISQQKHEWLLIVFCGLLGTIIDSILMYIKILNFSDTQLIIHNLVPLWLIALWCLFATVINHSLSYLNNKFILASLFGAIGGPLSYYAGTKLTDISFHSNHIFSFIIIGLIWSIILPALYQLNRLIIKKHSL